MCCGQRVCGENRVNPFPNFSSEQSKREQWRVTGARDCTKDSLWIFGANSAEKSRLMFIRTFRSPRKSSTRIVEPLENRIAPAAFFLSGGDLVIRDSSGTP